MRPPSCFVVPIRSISLFLFLLPLALLITLLSLQLLCSPTLVSLSVFPLTCFPYPHLSNTVFFERSHAQGFLWTDPVVFFFPRHHPRRSIPGKLPLCYLLRVMADQSMYNLEHGLPSWQINFDQALTSCSFQSGSRTTFLPHHPLSMISQILRLPASFSISNAHSPTTSVDTDTPPSKLFHQTSQHIRERLDPECLGNRHSRSRQCKDEDVLHIKVSFLAPNLFRKKLTLVSRSSTAIRPTERKEETRNQLSATARRLARWLKALFRIPPQSQYETKLSNPIASQHCVTFPI